MPWTDDRALVRAVLAGEDGAEDELLRRLRPLALGTARGRFGLDPSAAEEVWQELALLLWRDDRRLLRRWRGEGKLTTYLTVVVSRLCLQHRRTAARPEPEVAPAAGADPFEGAMQRERRRAVEAAMAKLSQRDRLLLVLHYRDERSPAEIATLLGLRPGAARKALHDARRRLRRRLERRRPELFDGAEGGPLPFDPRGLVDGH